MSEISESTCTSPLRRVLRVCRRIALNIVPLAEVSAQEWERFVESSDECWLYHHPLFLDLHLTDSRSFALVENGKVMGGCILYVNRSGLGKVLSQRYGPAGLALSPNIARKAYPLVRQHLIETARADGCHAVQLGLPALAPRYAEPDYLDSHLYHLGFNNTLRWGTRTHYTPSYATVIDLRDSEAKIWAGFSELTKRKCRAASRIRFTVEVLQRDVSREAWDEFVVNNAATMRKSALPPVAPPVLSKLRAAMDRGCAALLHLRVGAVSKGSLLLLTYKSAAFYFASGVLPDAYKDGFAAQLHWSAICELKRLGFAQYEVGQFYPELKGTKLSQIGEFKRTFGGKKRSVLAGEMITNDMRFLCLDLLPAYARRSLVKISFLKSFVRRVRMLSLPARS